MSDVFVSHRSKDKEIADRVVKYFEDKGLSCWMAPRDIVPGSDWAAAINTAITASKVFVIIYTAISAESASPVCLSTMQRTFSMPRLRIARSRLSPEIS